MPDITSSRTTPLQSRHASRTSLDGEKRFKRPDDLDLSRSNSRGAGSRSHTPSGGLSPLIIQNPEPLFRGETNTSLVLHHADEELEDGEPLNPYRPQSPSIPVHHGKETADKAGVILGIHNVFLVLPQFIVTTLSSLIFYLMEPGQSLPEHHPQSIPILTNATIDATEDMMQLTVRAGAAGGGGSPDAVGLIFR